MMKALLPFDTTALAPYWAAVRDTTSWIASAIGVAAAMGWVNLAVGLLSAVWLATQIYRFWRWEVYALRRRHQAEEATAHPPEPHP